MKVQAVQLFSPEELAERWGTTTKTLAQRRHIGTGPAFVRVSDRLIRYRADDIDEYERTHRFTRTDSPAPAA